MAKPEGGLARNASSLAACVIKLHRGGECTLFCNRVKRRRGSGLVIAKARSFVLPCAVLAALREIG